MEDEVQDTVAVPEQRITSPRRLIMSPNQDIVMVDTETDSGRIRTLAPASTDQELLDLEEELGRMALDLAPEGTSVTNIIQTVNVIKGKSTVDVSGFVEQTVKWEKQIFVKTRAYEDALGALTDCGHVTLLGAPGSGKTTMSLMLMDKHKRMGFRVLYFERLHHFSERCDISLNCPTLLVFDDVFGQSARAIDMVECRKAFDNLTNCLRNQERCQASRRRDNGCEDIFSYDFKVLMNSRTDVWKAVFRDLRQYRSLLLRPSTVVDLTSHSLDLYEKKKILETHVNHANLDLSPENIDSLVAIDNRTLGFPYMCKLLTDNYVFISDKTLFFERPLVYLVEKIQELFSPRSDTAALLVLMILKDGSLNITDLSSREMMVDRGEGQLLSKVEVVVPHLSVPDMMKAAKAQNKTFLALEGDTVRFNHPTMHDAVAYVVGEENPVFVVENCSLMFLVERVSLREESSSETSGADPLSFMIHLHVDSLHYLVKRLANETVEGNHALALSHQCFNTESVVKSLFEILESNKFDFHSLNCSYRLGFLFWSSFASLGPLCKMALEKMEFNEQEKLEGVLGCCMSGNDTALLSILDPGRSNKDLVQKVSSISIGDILDLTANEKKLYHSLSNASSPIRTELPEEEETPRMPGDRKDMLIHIAAVNGCKAVVKILLDVGTNVDARGGNYMTPLMHACFIDHVEMVQMLLERGANVNLLDEEGDSCLHLAARVGSVDIIKILHQRGMDINARGEHERTPIMYASYNGNEEAVHYLLKINAEADPDTTNLKNKDNCLHLACVRGQLKVVIYLIDENAVGVESKGQRGRTPIMYAGRHGHLDVVKELADRRAAVDVVDEGDFNCLHVSCISGSVELVRWLIEEVNKEDDQRYATDQDVLNVNSKTKTCRTPVMFALWFGFVDMVHLLIANGADLTLKDSVGMTCLHFAVKSGIKELIAICINNSQDINAMADNEFTPAMMASFKGDLNILEFLIEKGANISEDTCLHAACSGGKLETVKFILSRVQKNVHLKRLSTNGKTPFLWACSKGQFEIAKYLLCHDLDLSECDTHGRSCLHMAVQSGNTTLVEYLLVMERSLIDAVDDNGFTPLKCAIKRNFPDLVGLLVLKGADTAITDNHGGTYLHAAVWYGHVACCKKLLELDLDIDAVDNKGNFPLLAAFRNSSNRADIVTFLLERGANMYDTDQRGNTCLHAAAHWGGHPSTVAVLLEKGFAVNTKNDYDQTALMVACRSGNKALFDVLIGKQANIFQKDRNRASCLHMVAMHENDVVDIARELLNAGLNPVDEDVYKKTASMYAISKGNCKILDLLLSKSGLNHTIKNKKGFEDGTTLLHYACSLDRIDITIIQMLLSKNLRVDCINSYQQTPAMCAARKGRRDVIELLASKGANMARVDRNGRTCREHALEEGHVELAQFITTLARRRR